MFSSALWLYEFKFQMVSGYSTLVQFQSGTRDKMRALHYNSKGCKKKFKKYNTYAGQLERTYLSQILAMRDSPRPLRNMSRTVEACATMLPPTGFFGSAWKVIPPPGSAITWFVMYTAMLYSSESFWTLH